MTKRVGKPDAGDSRIKFYSWRDNGSKDKNPQTIADWKADIAKWKNKRFGYTFKGRPSDKAFWVFEEGSEYKPKENITSRRVLIGFDFDYMGKDVIKNEANQIYHEDEEFLGETKHPYSIIWKHNEQGAYGIGARIRGHLRVRNIWIANKDELRKALGVSEKEVHEFMKNQEDARREWTIVDREHERDDQGPRR